MSSGFRLLGGGMDDVRWCGVPMRAVRMRLRLKFLRQ